MINKRLLAYLKGKSSLDDESHSTEEARALVDELETISGKKITGNIRLVLEKIGEFNLARKYPTIKDIVILGLRYENKKKLIMRAKGRDLVVTHPRRKGHAIRYALSNMQDFETEDEVPYDVKPSVGAINVNEILKVATFYMDAVGEMLDHKFIEFHHIVIATELNYKDDYQYFEWSIPSQKNKAKVSNYTLTRYRGVLLSLYPNGRMIMTIRSSRHPFNLFTHDGLMDFYITCGQILEHFCRNIGGEKSLSADPMEWKVMQIDGAYDIPIKDLEIAVAEKIPVKKGGGISFKFPGGYLKVKHLNQLYQIYQKRLPYKGKCLRIENRLSFKQPYPSFKDIEYNYSDRNGNGEESRNKVQTEQGVTGINMQSIRR